jgi:hypothetical protein
LLRGATTAGTGSSSVASHADAWPDGPDCGCDGVALSLDPAGACTATPSIVRFVVGAGFWTGGDVACAGACTATPSIVRFVVGAGLGPACGAAGDGATGAAGIGPAGDGAGAGKAGDSIVGAKPLGAGAGAVAIGDDGSAVTGIPSIVRFGAGAAGAAGGATGATGVNAAGSTAAIPSIVRAMGDGGAAVVAGGAAGGGAACGGAACGADAGGTAYAGGGEDAGTEGTGANPPRPGALGAAAGDGGIATAGIPSMVRLGATGSGAMGAVAAMGAAGATGAMGAAGAGMPICATGIPSIVRFGSAGAGAAASGVGTVGRPTRSYPQLPQKRAPGVVGVPHCGQGSAIAAESISRIAAPARSSSPRSSARRATSSGRRSSSTRPPPFVDAPAFDIHGRARSPGSSSPTGRLAAFEPPHGSCMGFGVDPAVVTPARTSESGSAPDRD